MEFAMTPRTGSHNINPSPRIVVFGCGNILLGDDGFGPAVIATLLEENTFPADVRIEDVGTGIREILFDYLLSEVLRPDCLVVVDAARHEGRTPGEVFEIRPEFVAASKIHDFSLHQFPTVNMLRELAEATNTKVRIIVAQVERIPERVEPGMSGVVCAAVPMACKLVLDIIAEHI